MAKLPNLSDTVVACATPDGEGGVAVVRISGKESFSVLQKLFRTKKTHSWTWGQMHHGVVIDPKNNDPIDEALAVFFPKPHSYTGEDSVEIQVHGSRAVVSAVLDAAIFAGARMATAGEFTLRAFASGRIDLTQAEAVADLISSTNEIARKNSLKIMQGELYDRISQLRELLIRSAAEIEAYLDFPEEDIEPKTSDIIDGWLLDVESYCDNLANTFDIGKRLSKGIRVVIAGAPNAGKSSLLNQLLGFDRAITSPKPGTTRDFVAEQLILDGVYIELVDTAGLRTGEDFIEEQGIKLAYDMIDKSDFVLVVKDASVPFNKEDIDAIGLLDHHEGLLVLNKIDISDSDSKFEAPNKERALDRIWVSCKTGEGIEELKDKIAMFAKKISLAGENLVITNHRQFDLLVRARSEIKRAREYLHTGESLEVAALYVRSAISALSELIGETTPDDVLADIFSRFCVGK